MELVTVSQTNQEYVITLKEITDLIGVRHDKSMAKVEELAIEDGFGSLSILDIQYQSGKGRIDTIQTYQFTKKQAIEYERDNPEYYIELMEDELETEDE